MAGVAKAGVIKNADHVVRSSLTRKVIAIVVSSLVVLLAVVYAISFFYERYGVFTVSISRYDMLKQGLSLSETSMFEKPISLLNADTVRTLTNISEDTLPANIDAINGAHSGENYVAYTFYLKNTGKDTVTYDASIFISNVTLDIDEAIRIKVYTNGIPKTYAKTKKDGSGPESGTVEFVTNTIATKDIRADFKPGDVDKFTVVIWLEGNDPECLDNIVGGRLKADMKFTIIEGS